MSDDPASPIEPLPGSPAEQIEAACHRFEAAWRAGGQPRIEDYLAVASPGAQPDVQRELLCGLVGIDLEYRWRPAGATPTDTAKVAPAEQAPAASSPLPARPRLDDYLLPYPALGPLDQLPLELIVEEYRVRHRWGDRPGHDEYLERFGRQRSGLSRMLTQTDRELASGETIGQPGWPDQGWSEQYDTPSRRIAQLKRLGDYELQEKLGHGGMGVVYKARQVLLNQVVALKVLPEKYLDEPQAVSRFLREMQLIGGLNHPNIVQAHNAGEQQGVHYLVMEYVDGITLEQLVGRRGPLPMGAASELIRQAALGLQHANLHGLVHRDIKPANLMLSYGGTLKILDLGLARLRADRQSVGQLTEHGVSEPGIAIGTVDYMAPEQWEDSSAVDIRADIYSLGCTLFYLLTGRAPYGDPCYDTIRKKLKAHAAAPIPSLVQSRSDCPRQFDRLLSRMLAKEVADRFQTPAEVAEAVERFADLDELGELLSFETAGDRSELADDPGLASSGLERWRRRFGPSGPRPSSRPPLRKPSYRRLKVIAGLILVAALAAGLAHQWLSRPVRLPWQQQLRAEMGSLPGLKGRWWFDEISRFVPAVRARLIEAIDRGESEIAGVALPSLAASARGSDVDVLYDELAKISDVLKERIPDGRERKLVTEVQTLLGDPDQMSPQSYRKQLSEVKGTIEEMRAIATATALHLGAVLQHELARHKLAEWSEAKAGYEAALRKYQESGAEEAEILRVLCMADYSQMLFDSRQYKDSISYFQEARRNFAAPALVIATLCQEADASRKLRPIPRPSHALKCLQEAEDNPGLPPDHPLRAHIVERRAWVQMDTWQFSEAIASFNEGLQIRAKHEQKQGAATTEFALWSRQGIAMAHHFLGEKEKVKSEFNALLSDIPDAASPEGYAQRRKAERRPNVLERYADWFLVGADDLDYRSAVHYLNEGIQQARFLHFHQDYRAPYVLRLRYKLMLARALAPDSSAEAADPGASTDDPDSEIFAEARQVAEALVKLQAAIKTHDQTGLQPLLAIIADAEPGTHLARNKVGLLLLAIEAGCNSRMLEPDQLKTVAQQLIEIANVTAMGKDQGIRKFLRRYFEAVQRELARLPEDPPGVNLSKERGLIQEWLR